MQLHLAALLLGVAGLGSAGIADLEGVRHAARQDYVGGSLDCAAYGGANGGSNGGNRPIPSGQCCVARTSLNQDACIADNGQQGRCVPGGNNCTSCVSLCSHVYARPSLF